MRLTHTGEDGFMLYIPSEVSVNRWGKVNWRFVLVCPVCLRSIDGARKGLWHYQCWVGGSEANIDPLYFIRIRLVTSLNELSESSACTHFGDKTSTRRPRHSISTGNFAFHLMSVSSFIRDGYGYEFVSRKNLSEKQRCWNKRRKASINASFNSCSKIMILISIHGRSPDLSFSKSSIILLFRPWSGEPIYRNGEFCGFVTSTAYGFTLGKQVMTSASIFHFSRHICRSAGLLGLCSRAWHR